MMRSKTIGAVAAVMLALAAAAAGAADRPNIILILADDMGYADAGCFGGKAAATPHLDALAASGVKLTRFYAASAVCSPTRASILSGRYPLRFDIRHHFPDDESHLPGGTVTLPRLLRDAGYATSHVGKWHLGGLHLAHARDRARSIPGPREHGFDHSLSQVEEQPLRPTLGKVRRLYRDGGTCLVRDDEAVGADDPFYRMHLTDIFSAEAIRHVEAAHAAGRPFFLNLWHLVPHTPYEPGSEPHWSQAAADGISDDQRRFRSMMMHMDATIGALVAKLDELGIRENTLIVFTSDNGGAYESDNGPFKAGKTDLHEGGIRVPFIASWPGKIPPGRVCGALTGTIDLLSTFCAAAGVEVPAAAAVDGIDLLPLLTGARETLDRGPMFWQLDLYSRMQRQAPKPKPFATEAVMRGPWKLLTRDGAPVELFDLDADPGEAVNLLAREPALAAELAAEVRGFLAAPRDRSGLPPEARPRTPEATPPAERQSGLRGP
jgi:N-acetylgalactosamine-6-sulfatase